MTINDFDKAPCGYFSFYDDGEILAVNESLCTLLEYEKGEVAGKNVEFIFTLPTRIFYQTHFFPLVKMHGHAEEIFITLLTKSGAHLPVLLNAQREVREDRSFTACAFIVVTNRKKFEDELIAARKQAEAALRENSALIKARSDLQKHSEQLDAQIHVVNKQNHELKQLSHVITHSLKEPLRKILLFADRLQVKSAAGEADPILTRLIRASSQMRTTVKGLQQYIWIDDSPVHFAPMQLQEVIRKAKEQLDVEMGEGLLELEVHPLPQVEADAEQLTLLFYHLLSNSVKFKKGNKAFVEITCSLIQQNRFTNVEGKYHYEDFVKLEISDKGTGFDPSFNEPVFELFRKLHFEQGIGLGLALCRKIAANHFGFIKAEGRVNEGATITILLPVIQSFSQQQPTTVNKKTMV